MGDFAGAVIKALAARDIKLASPDLINECVDMAHTFGLGAEHVADAFQAVDASEVTRAIIGKVRQDQAKAAAKSGRKPGAAAPFVASTPAKFDKTSVATMPGYSSAVGGGGGFSTRSAPTPGSGALPSGSASVSGVKRPASAVSPSGPVTGGARSAATPFTPGAAHSTSYTAAGTPPPTTNHYALRSTAGQVVETHNKDLGSTSSTTADASASAAGAASAAVAGRPYARLTLNDLRDTGFLPHEKPVKIIASGSTSGTLEKPAVVYSGAPTEPLPLVVASIESYSAVTGVRVAWPALAEAMQACAPVTYSLAHLADAAGIAAPASAVSPTAGGAASASISGAASPAAPASPVLSPAASPPAAPASPVAATAGAGTSAPASPATPAQSASGAAATPAASAAEALAAARPDVVAAVAAGLQVLDPFADFVPGVSSGASGAATPDGRGSPALGAGSASRLSAPATPQSPASADAAISATAGAASALLDGTQKVGFLPATYHPAAGGSYTPYAPITSRNVGGKPYRYMFTTLRERAENLEGRLDEVAIAMVQAYGLGELVTPVGTVSARPVVFVGRIVVNSETGDGRINRTSVLLEGSRDDAAATSSIGRVALDLSEVPGFSLFPGQVVAVKGICSRPDRMVVQAIYHGVPPPPAAMHAMNARAIADAAFKKGSGPLRVWVAAGPYTTTADLAYQPLDDLLVEAAEAKPQPDVIVLTGPFVDAEHPMVKSGEIIVRNADGEAVAATSRDLWEGTISPILEEHLATMLPKTHVVLQSAWSDAISHPIVPGWPLTDRDTAVFEDESVRKRVTVVSNPATFTVGGVIFGSTSTDVLYTMNRDETTSLKPTVPGGGPKMEKVVRLAQHVLEQRSFLPMFPAPASEAEPGVPVEMNQLWHLGLPVAPDVLVLPSRLKAFVKHVGPTLMVNPGNLTRGTIGGTYAKLAIFPQTAASMRTVKLTAADEAEDATAAEEFVLADVPDRTRAEIVRI